MEGNRPGKRERHEKQRSTAFPCRKQANSFERYSCQIPFVRIIAQLFENVKGFAILFLIGPLWWLCRYAGIPRPDR